MEDWNHTAELSVQAASRRSNGAVKKECCSASNCSFLYLWTNSMPVMPQLEGEKTVAAATSGMYSSAKKILKIKKLLMWTALYF